MTIPRTYDEKQPQAENQFSTREALTLLLLVCSADVTLARLLIRRISALNAWYSFSRVALYVDNDLHEDEVHDLICPILPESVTPPAIFRDPIVNRWNIDRVGMVLEAYRQALSLGCPLLRMDCDIFIAHPQFFNELQRPFPGFAGRKMSFFLPALIRGHQLEFIQGGVTRVGEVAANMLMDIRPQQIKEMKEHPERFLDTGQGDITDKHQRFFRSAEDIFLSGVEAKRRGVPLLGIPNLQVSPYDILRDYTNSSHDALEHWQAFRSSGALAYHYESGHDGRHPLLLKYLKWAYLHAAVQRE